MRSIDSRFDDSDVPSQIVVVCLNHVYGYAFRIFLFIQMGRELLVQQRLACFFLWRYLLTKCTVDLFLYVGSASLFVSFAI